MAHRAMAEPLDEIGATVPFDRFCRVWLVFAVVEVERPPTQNQLPVVIGELQVVRPVRVVRWRDRTQIREDRVRIRLLPVAPRATTAAIAIRAAIRPYSIAVAPSWFLKSVVNGFNMKQSSLGLLIR
jgi:hypothetical protein